MALALLQLLPNTGSNCGQEWPLPTPPPTALFAVVSSASSIHEKGGTSLLAIIATTTPPCFGIIVQEAHTDIAGMVWLHQINAPNYHICLVLNATLKCNAMEDIVCECTRLTCWLLHAIAQLVVPVVTKVFLPSAKSTGLTGLSLICKKDLPPCLQALGKHAPDDIDEDVIFVVGLLGLWNQYPLCKNLCGKILIQMWKNNK